MRAKEIFQCLDMSVQKAIVDDDEDGASAH